MRSTRIIPDNYIRPIGIKQEGDIVEFSGTGFGYQSAGIVMTASHVVCGTKPENIYMQLVDGSFVNPHSVAIHPSADIAAMLFDRSKAPLCFSKGVPAGSGAIYELGTSVISYGFPYIDIGGNRKELEPRLLTGNIQRCFKYAIGSMHYEAYELSFPTPVGLSGSPVMLENNIDFAIGVVTTNFESSTVIDSYEEHQEDGTKEIHKTIKVTTYGIAATLFSIDDWIDSAVIPLLR